MRFPARLEAMAFISLVFCSLLSFAYSPVGETSKILSTSKINLPNWPSEYQGKKLQRIALSKREKYYLGGFPGKMARFTDGRRQLIMRWVTKPSRLLHPAVDCFRGLGYKISNIKIKRDKFNKLWRIFDADKKGIKIEVSEQIVDKNNRVFTDTSTWYWNAMLNKSQGPWLAITIAEYRRPTRE